MFAKENGITLLGVFILLELLYNRPPASDSNGGVLSGISWVFAGIRQGFWLRLSVLMAWVSAVMSYRISVHQGAALYKWTVLENQMSLMEPVRVCTT